MGISSRSTMTTQLLSFFLVCSLFLIPASTHLLLLPSEESQEERHISVLVTDKGIDFGKDLLIEKAISTLIPLQLSDIQRSRKIPLIGRVNFSLTNITIYTANIASSYVETEEEGLMLVASGGANLSMTWEYSYKNWAFKFSDRGDASVQVEGMEVAVAVAVQEQGGSIELSILDCGCDVSDISIKVDGGASWLYEGIFDAFQKPLKSAVEVAISKKIKEGMGKLDSRLRSLPKQIPLGHVVTLNVTFVDDPLLTDSSIKFGINGLFTASENLIYPNYHNYHQVIQPSYSSNKSPQMTRISIDEDVLNTAAYVYFMADYFVWKVDKFVNQSLLNTSAWEDVCPELYKQYPDDGMSLNVSVTSPPLIKVSEHGIEFTIYSDVSVSVLDAGELVPVACLSFVIDASCSPEILENKLVGVLEVTDFTMSMKWSTIGNASINLLQSALSDVLETVLIPYANSRLTQGIHLPRFHGVSLQNAELHSTESKIIVYSDLAYT